MNQTVENTFLLVENLVENPDVSSSYETDKAVQSIFDFFCNINFRNVSISHDEEEQLKLLIEKRSLSFGNFLADMDSKFGFFEGFDEWRGFCISRSAFQFITRLFGSDIDKLAPGFSLEDLTEFDQRMMEMAEMEGQYSQDKIPLGVPDSHWWWSRTEP